MGDPRQAAREELNRQKMAAVLSVIKGRNSLAPVTGKSIAFKTGLSSDVTVRGAINQLRQDGAAICSNGDGYWYATTAYELQSTIEELEGRVSAVNNAIAGLRIARDRMNRETHTEATIVIDDAWDLDDILNSAE